MKRYPKYGPALLIVLLSLTNISFVKGQSEANRYTLKLYTNFFYNSFQDFSEAPETHTSNIFDFGRITPALQIQNANANFQEFELSRFTFNHNYDLLEEYDSTNNFSEWIMGSITNEFALVLKYEYNYAFLKQNQKYHPYIGASLSPSISFLDFKSMVSRVYPYRNFELGTTLHIIPRLIIDLSERLVLDINIPVNIASLSWSKYEIFDPNIPEYERRISEIKLRENLELKSIYFRVGLGIKL